MSGRNLSLREAIAHERELLTPIRETADLIIDTTRTSVHELRDAVRSRIQQRAEGKLSLLFESFGYKHGIPSDADFVIDVRCLPNPYWDHALRPWSRKDAPVVDYLERQLDVRKMLADLTAFLETWIPAFKQSNRSYLTIAIGCTGGQHRSVYIAERLAALQRERRSRTDTSHRAVCSLRRSVRRLTSQVDPPRSRRYPSRPFGFHIYSARLRIT